METRTDHDLLREFAAGRRAALAELARRYERALLGVASGLLRGRRDLAQDAVQETWMRVVRFAGSFNGQSTVKTWLYRIAVNQCRTLAAVNARHTGSNDTQNHRSGLALALDAPDLAAARKEVAANLLAAVHALGEQKAAVILLCYHEGMTHDEAAEVLALPVGTVKSRLHAALKELRESLTPGE